MDARDRVLELDATLRAQAAALDAKPWPNRAAAALRIAEILGSVRSAGIALRPNEVTELVNTGTTPAGRSLEACNAVADYAAAAAHASVIGQRRRQPLIRVEEIVALHALATRRSSYERPGKWRTATAGAQRSGAVPPPAWLVPRDMAALAERFANRPAPERPTLLCLADFHARLTRIHPFATANGRVARLCLNLLLTRLRYPPFLIGRGQAPRFSAVLDRAAAGDLWPSALFFGESLLKAADKLGPSGDSAGETLVSIAAIASPGERAALYKAAQRGRLRTVREGTFVFTSKIWLDEYRMSRAAAGRPPTARPLS